MTRVSIPTGALIAGTAFTSLPSGRTAVSQDAPLAEPISIVSSEVIELAPRIADDASPLPKQAILVSEQEWTQKMERQFLRYAEREALGKLSPNERVELDRLSNLRFRLKTPRKGEEILMEFQQRQVMNDLLQALQRYVQFVKTSRN